MPYPVAAVQGGSLRYPASSFTGAYDSIPNIAAAYGMRRLLTSYTSNLLRLRRSSDNSEQDFGYTSTGDLDTAAIATFVGGGSGFVVTWYDQSGNGKNATQSTATNQPLYVASGQNGHPVARGDGTNDRLVITRNASAAMSVLAVAIKRSAPDSNSKALWTLGDNAQYYANSGTSAAGWSYFGANTALGGTCTNWNVLAAIYASVSSMTNYINGGSSVTLNPDDSYSSATSMNLFSNGANNFSDTDIAEFVIASAAWSSGERAAAESAANSYWAVY